MEIRQAHGGSKEAQDVGEAQHVRENMHRREEEKERLALFQTRAVGRIRLRVAAALCISYCVRDVDYGKEKYIISLKHELPACLFSLA